MKVGDLLAKRFELQERLGSGGLGEVFRAKDSRGARVVTIKVYDPARCPAEGMRGYETLIASAARGEQIGVLLPRLLVALTATPPFVVSETLAGEDLGAFRLRSGSLPWQRAVEIGQTCAEGLASLLASTGAAHRALKPGNVWIGEDGAVKLLDFGVAELGVQAVGPRPDGTVAEYRAPEQLEGGPGDSRSDVFSLGVLLFELLTGIHPFSGPSSYKAAHRMLLQPAPRAREVAPTVTVPTEVEALLMRALARQPADRWKDAAELAAQFVRVRRAPGAIPRPAASPSVAAPAMEMTQAMPVSPGYQEDSTTALSAPALRILLAPKAAALMVAAPSAADVPIKDPGLLGSVAASMPVKAPEDGPPLLAVAEPTAALPTAPNQLRRTNPRPVSVPFETRPAVIAPLPEVTEALPPPPARHLAPSLAAQDSDDEATLALSRAPRSQSPFADATEALPANSRPGVPMPTSKPAALPPVQAPPSAKPASQPALASSAVRHSSPAESVAYPGSVASSPAPLAPPARRILIMVNVALGITIIVITVALMLRP